MAFPIALNTSNGSRYEDNCHKALDCWNRVWVLYATVLSKGIINSTSLRWSDSSTLESHSSEQQCYFHNLNPDLSCTFWSFSYPMLGWRWNVKFLEMLVCTSGGSKEKTEWNAWQHSERVERINQRLKRWNDISVISQTEYLASKPTNEIESFSNSTHSEWGVVINKPHVMAESSLLVQIRTDI